MKKQLRSFGYAFEGLWGAIRTESHLRFHLVAALYVCLFAFLGEFTTSQWGVLILTICSVISAELVNTCLEDLCDLYSTEKNPKIKRIKDIAACAVLIFAIGAALIAILLFISTGKLQLAFSKLTANPLWFIPLGLSAVISAIFVIFGGKKKSEPNT